MDLSLLRHKLQDWYHQNKRDLPWRENTQAYSIWLSEIILQQTRVSQGLPYYERFMAKYPNPVALANAPEEEVLKLWEGLGYYSRARNLQAAARSLRDDHQGKFPEDYTQIRALKGVGDYTAASIASFAFNQVKAVVDGNVYRVLSRLTADDTAINTNAGKKAFQAYADSFIDPEQPALHNQAIMEFGAMQCKPKNPDCKLCPFQENCKAYARGLVQELPFKKKKSYDKQRYLNYLHFAGNEKVILERRSEGIWKGLFQFPLLEQEEPMNWEEIHEEIREHFQLDLNKEQVLSIPLPKHKLSHQTLHIKVWHIGDLDLESLDWDSGLILEEKERVFELAFPRPLRKYLDENQLNLPFD